MGPLETALAFSLLLLVQGCKLLPFGDTCDTLTVYGGRLEDSNVYVDFMSGETVYTGYIVCGKSAIRKNARKYFNCQRRTTGCPIPGSEDHEEISRSILETCFPEKSLRDRIRKAAVISANNEVMVPSRPLSPVVNDDSVVSLMFQKLVILNNVYDIFLIDPSEYIQVSLSPMIASKFQFKDDSKVVVLRQLLYFLSDIANDSGSIDSINTCPSKRYAHSDPIDPNTVQNTVLSYWVQGGWLVLFDSGNIENPPVSALTQDAECCICLNSINDSSDTLGSRILSCGHSFHETCINEWIASHPSCPNCRRELP